MMTDSEYEGEELEVFGRAENWKTYFAGIIAPYLRGSVLEVGAGQGKTTQVLTENAPAVDSWVCLEPDPTFCSRIRDLLRNGQLPKYCTTINGTTNTLRNRQQFNVILYVDVLEHIENDEVECEKAFSMLQEGGSLIILAPAHSFLFSDFDRSIGHYRRYDKSTMKAVVPEQFELLDLKYLDSVGLLLSSLNKILLHQGKPSEKQVLFWDRIAVPCSKVIDPLLRYSLGKTLLGIWKK